METTNVLINFEDNKLFLADDGNDFVAKDNNRYSVRCTDFRDTADHYIVKGERVFHSFAWTIGIDRDWYTDEEVEKSRFVLSAFSKPSDRSRLKWTSRFPFIEKETKSGRYLKEGWQLIKETREAYVKLPKAAYAVIDNRTKTEQ